MKFGYVLLVLCLYADYCQVEQVVIAVRGHETESYIAVHHSCLSYSAA